MGVIDKKIEKIINNRVYKLKTPHNRDKDVCFKKNSVDIGG